MQEICAAAQLSPGSVYRYFPSKEAIIEALAADYQEETDGPSLTPGPGESAEEALVRWVLDGGASTLEPGDAALYFDILVESERNPRIRETALRFEAGLLRRLEVAVRGCLGEGVEPAPERIRAAAVLLLSLSDGIFMRRFLLPAAESGSLDALLQPSLLAVIRACLGTDGSAPR